MEIFVGNTARLVEDVLAEVLEPPPPVDYLAWAVNNIKFSERESAISGDYNRALFPYFDEVLRALSPADPCRIVTLKGGAQIGKTVLANIFTLGSLHMAPGDFLYVHPTEDNAKRWSRMKLTPMLKNTTALASLFSSKARDAADTILYKERVDGRGAIQISGANSAVSLSMVSMRRQVQDDLAKWEVNMGGDPESQADSRSKGYKYAKIFKVSTPLLMPGCRITRNFEAGSQEVYEVPCPHCEVFQTLDWDNMLAHLNEDKPEEACFYCTSCGGQIKEHERDRMMLRGRMVAQNPKAKREHRSFYVWSAYSVLETWEGIARAWLKAKGDPAAEQTFLNDYVGMAYRVTGEAVGWEVLRDRAEVSTYARGRIPDGALVITIGVDCQKDRVECTILAHGRDNRRFVIEYVVIHGHISEECCQTELDKLLARTWTFPGGRKFVADMLGIDGNAWTEDVWSWVKRHPSSRVIMLRGANMDNAPLLSKVKKEHNAQGVKLKYSKRFYNFGASTLKMSLYRDLSKTDPMARGHIAFPRGLDDEYYRMLTAERRQGIKNKKSGFMVYRWIKDADQANEALDTFNQAMSAAIRLGMRAWQDDVWDRYDLERATLLPDAQFDLEDLLLPGAVSTAAPAAPLSPPETPKPEPAHATADPWLETHEDWI